VNADSRFNSRQVNWLINTIRSLSKPTAPSAGGGGEKDLSEVGIANGDACGFKPIFQKQEESDELVHGIWIANWPADEATTMPPIRNLELETESA